ncbi:MAG TPA: hypothetical protein VEZ90_16645 [Blastocatellia bacterium]|nr:hypothetical protein [Blastocatellia bacterium]
MWLDGSAQDAVDRFWEKCGEIESFPRNLERPIALALPVALVKLPKLTLNDVEGWLRKRGAPMNFGCRSRPIRGCVVGYRGLGMIFVDGSDPENERRFTLAHEAAHFMIDYWLPRDLAMRKLGPGVGEVLDGLRKPTLSENVHSLLASVPLEVYVTLMARDETYGGLYSRLWSAEDKADRLALALLAPPEAVLAEVDLSQKRFEERRAAVRVGLLERFGLPAYLAESYSSALLTDAGLGRSWIEDLGVN